jgi:hypothetical protein
MYGQILIPCQVCGEEFANDQLVRCYNDHVFCAEHLPEGVYIKARNDFILSMSPGRLVSDTTVLISDRDNWSSCFEAVFPEEFCPICNGSYIRDFEVLDYLLAQSGKTFEEIKTIIKQQRATLAKGTVDEQE